VFGEHKHLVISLLNALLPLKDDEHVESIEYWPAEKVPDRPLAEKDSIVDVCCKDNKNREFIVEMQMTWTDSFKKRVLLNASKAYVAQSKKGDDYELLQPVYALNFVNENFMNDVDDYYHLVHDKYTDKVIDGLHLIFVELKKFKPQTYTEKKMQVLWLRFLTEINDETREVPAELLENAEVSEALEIVERAAFDDAEMRAYDKFWDSIASRKSEINAVKREAEKAKAEAEEAKTKLKQEKLDTARKMKVKGYAVEDIAEITGLTTELIEAL
jgi:predicted transposase/invertase (TIGR01784 family)